MREPKPEERKSRANFYVKGTTPPKVDFGEQATVTATGKIKSIGEDYDGKGYNLDIEPATISVNGAEMPSTMAKDMKKAKKKMTMPGMDDDSEDME